MAIKKRPLASRPSLHTSLFSLHDPTPSRTPSRDLEDLLLYAKECGRTVTFWKVEGGYQANAKRRNTHSYMVGAGSTKAEALWNCFALFLKDGAFRKDSKIRMLPKPRKRM